MSDVKPFHWENAYGGAGGSVIRAESMRDSEGELVLSVGYDSADITIRDVATGELLAMAPVLREALRALVDVQNGPPLISLTEEWTKAMSLAADALKKAQP